MPSSAPTAAALAALAVLAAAACVAARPGPAAVPGYQALWPQPVTVRATEGASVPVDAAGFRVVAASGAGCQPLPDLLNTAVKGFLARAFPFGGAASSSSSSSVASVEVCVTEPAAKLAYGVDESYSLAVPASGAATVSATTPFGAMHALQTLSQLVTYDWETKAYAVGGAPLTVSDAPRFSWRGMLVDTARHFLRPATLERQIDAMAASKLNVLHWHIVDAQSFPFVSQSFPRLAGDGSYHPSAVYTPEVVAGLVQYGLERGVRVVPEFDLPGHSASWSFGYPDVVTNCPSYAHNINNLNLSPAANMTLPMIQGVLGDAAKLFGDEYVHLGGDEVVEACWGEDPAVQAWMKARNTDTKGVYQYFVNKTTAAATAVGRRAVQWQEVIDNGLAVPLSTVIEVWKHGDMQRVTGMGYHTIYAAGYYLDQQVPDPPFEFYEFEDTWKSMYVTDPVYNLTEAEGDLVIGGEAAMWSEQVSDGSIDARVWPRAAAVAERLWSPAAQLPPPAQPSKVPASAVTRLNQHSCRLQRMGVGSSPVHPAFCLLPQ